MVEAVLEYIGVRRRRSEPTPAMRSLREREALAEEQAEAALNGLRAVRYEYDPRCKDERRRRLDSINARIDRQKERISTLKEGSSGG